MANFIQYKKIVIDQKEEIELFFKNNIIRRESLEHFQTIYRSKLIKIVIGVRRCGKSVFIHQSLKDLNIEYAYVNFDDERFQGLPASELSPIHEVLLELYPNIKTYVFDEIQNVMGWELFVNRLKRNGYNIFITGSNANLLSREMATHLTGRHLEFRLWPFSFREFLRYHQVRVPDSLDELSTRSTAEIKKHFEIFFKNGGFPEVVAGEPSGPYLRSLFDSIVMRDIVSRYALRETSRIKELARYCLVHPGSRFTHNSLLKTFKFRSATTIQKYIDYLKEVFLLTELQEFDFKVKEQIKKPRKLYAIDSGLEKAFSGDGSFGEGRRMEMVVLSELLRKAKPVYFGMLGGYEIDFVTATESREVERLIQVCYSLRDPETRLREIRALERGHPLYRSGSLELITWDEEDELIISGKKKIKVIPLWKWLLLPHGTNFF